MRLLLVEDEVERMITTMKTLVRQRLTAPWPRQLLPRRLGGLESGADMVMRLLLMREFNFDPAIMSTSAIRTHLPYMAAPSSCGSALCDISAFLV